MLGSGIYVRLRFQRTAIPVMSHITWNSTQNGLHVLA